MQGDSTPSSLPPSPSSYSLQSVASSSSLTIHKDRHSMITAMPTSMNNRIYAYRSSLMASRKLSQLPDLILDTGFRDGWRSEVMDDLTGARLLPAPLPLEDFLEEIGSSLRRVSDTFERLRKSTRNGYYGKLVSMPNRTKHQIILHFLITLPFNFILNSLNWTRYFNQYGLNVGHH